MKDSWNPNQYHLFKDERSRPFFDLLNMVEERQRMTVVDLGCGTGELTKSLHEKLHPDSTLGVDNSPTMLNEARVFESGTLKFENGSIEGFLRPGFYDLVFSNAALQWCENHDTLLENFRQSLKPKGQLAVQMPANHDYPTHVLAAEIAAGEPWATRLKGYRRDSPVRAPEHYGRLLHRLGFQRQHVRMEVYGHLLADRNGVIEWVRGTLLTAYESRLSAEHYAEFLAELKRRLFQVLPDEKPFYYPFKRILFWGSLE